ncbi:MAG TPA: glycosyl hydrolase 115 family protein, partial [Sphingomicrobium sp.]
MLRRAVCALALALFLAVRANAQLPDWIEERPSAGSVALAGANVVTAPGDHEVVQIAAEDLRRDLQRVTAGGSGGTPIWAGTIGRSPAIDQLDASGKLDVTALKGRWESFVIATVERPAPGVPRALVIVGSDRRGTAYGIYELSRAIGVSPWHWWADVTPLRRSGLFVRAGTQRFGPPSVKYRGIFINDEDWGLTPWSATNFEPGTAGMGPKTYAKVFELLLRLKANTLWPAMHKISPAFNTNPDNARLADRFAIVMGSSHAEPMLRNNVGEWTADSRDYDYGKKPDVVRAYWEERVRSNGRFENIYTLGMRGIHDSGMQGANDMPTRRRMLESIFADQRGMISRHVSPRVERVPQVFTPYKEVLDVYRAGLTVPDDVTIMWPDDNFGYIRRFPAATERNRSGGSGIYYHLSYLG